MVNRNDQCKLTLLRNDLHKQANGGLKNANINNLMLTNHFILQLKPLFMGIWGGGGLQSSHKNTVYMWQRLALAGVKMHPKENKAVADKNTSGCTIISIH